MMPYPINDNDVDDRTRGDYSTNQAFYAKSDMPMGGEITEEMIDYQSQVDCSPGGGVPWQSPFC